MMCSARNPSVASPGPSRLSDGAQYDRVASCMAMDVIRALNHLLAVLFVLILDTIRFLSQSLRSRAALSAENLFLRRQLALYAERKVKARRANDGGRLGWFSCRGSLPGRMP